MVRRTTVLPGRSGWGAARRESPRRGSRLRETFGPDHHIGGQDAGEWAIRAEPDIRRRLADAEESCALHRVSSPGIPGIQRDIGEKLLGGRRRILFGSVEHSQVEDAALSSRMALPRAVNEGSAPHPAVC